MCWTLRRFVEHADCISEALCCKQRQGKLLLIMQIIDFLESVAEEHGEVTGVANLIGNMCIKPAHLTSDEEVCPPSRLHP